ncbi:hypothetical protein C2G38_1445266 [Gigaspora rosea]|uniref:Uncharacterized protein n=1 Tax=Gigaspora rosea TaxID=44941 RepID=A0A397V5T6_9GLOM|nr:hypothetical protein C2G38_1445266 [Gigaspora rosea]
MQMNYILNVDSKNALKSRLTCLPIHTVCLHELREKNKLYLFAHELVEHSPDKAIITWRCFNFLIDQNDEARRYFTKASAMDSHCGPAWVVFTIESENDQAITAYSTAAKLYPGSQICESNLLVLNELGVLYFQKLKYAQSVDSFKNALKVAEKTKCRPQVWETI